MCTIMISVHYNIGLNVYINIYCKYFNIFYLLFWCYQLPATLVPTVPACIEMINAYLETDSYYDMTKMYNASNVEQLKVEIWKSESRRRISYFQNFSRRNAKKKLEGWIFVIWSTMMNKYYPVRQTQGYFHIYGRYLLNYLGKSASKDTRFLGLDLLIIKRGFSFMACFYFYRIGRSGVRRSYTSRR